MFETFVEKLLSGYLSEWIEDSKLHLSVWAGQISLQNLTVRRDALAQWKLPVQIADGQIGSLQITVHCRKPFFCCWL